MKVKISIDDGNGRKSEIEIDESDKLANLVIIQNVFNLFGINTDILEMVDTFSRAGKAYSHFFSEVDPIEINPSGITKEKLNKNEIKEKLIQGLTENKEKIESTYEEDVPEHIITGIKEKDGKKLYRLHYKCEACYNTGTHYVYENSKVTWCHKCGSEMSISPAHPKGFPNTDMFNNFFRAGIFKDRNLFN